MYWYTVLVMLETAIDLQTLYDASLIAASSRNPSYHYVQLKWGPNERPAHSVVIVRAASWYAAYQRTVPTYLSHSSGEIYVPRKVIRQLCKKVSRAAFGNRVVVRLYDDEKTVSLHVMAEDYRSELANITYSLPQYVHFYQVKMPSERKVQTDDQTKFSAQNLGLLLKMGVCSHSPKKYSINLIYKPELSWQTMWSVDYLDSWPAWVLFTW